jgi:hypothetical protein
VLLVLQLLLVLQVLLKPKLLLEPLLELLLEVRLRQGQGPSGSGRDASDGPFMLEPSVVVESDSTGSRSSGCRTLGPEVGDHGTRGTGPTTIMIVVMRTGTRMVFPAATQAGTIQ